jgi:hypothetical protein
MRNGRHTELESVLYFLYNIAIVYCLFGVNSGPAH